jgi:hypothetical protein
VLSGGFERFFQRMGTPTDSAAADQPPFIPDLNRILAAGQARRPGRLHIGSDHFAVRFARFIPT